MASEVGRAGLRPSPPASEAERRHREKFAWWNGHGREGPIPSNVEWDRLSDDANAATRVHRKPTRTLSGVAVVAVMTSPARCPHGRCTYCPGGVESGTPQSYTGEEPSALRGAEFGFDARAITEHRLQVLSTIGHPTSKVEVIVMGGTFPARPETFRDEVFRGVFNGLNGATAPTLAEAQRRNETTEHRCVSLTVETRPDWCDGRVLPSLLRAGVTRVEVGVECLDDAVLLASGRAHGVAEVVAASREVRDRGLKLAYHMMLGLPGMSPGRDVATFRRLFADPAFCPDMLKIYPTLVLPGTELFEEWKSGRYRPYELHEAAAVLAQIKRELPPWVRIQRIQRDIPARLIAAGVRAGNLRQYALLELARHGGRCPCLRCAEPGRRADPPPDEFSEVSRSYPASGGIERFLSFEHPETETVGAFLRLRFPSSGTDGGLPAPVVRELKVLGAELPVGAAARPGTLQHRGVGARLLERAEEDAVLSGFAELFVTSAVGTREYYARRGYVRVGSYMRKALNHGS